MMKILITGANGALGRELVEVLQKDYDVYGCMLEDDRRPKFFYCDITDRIGTIKAIERVSPRVVIHAAAATDVERCEADRAWAMKVNFEGTKNVVDGCRHVKGVFIYISTDFIFSGNRKEPYAEGAIPHPNNVYGESKLLGEFYAREQSLQYLIFRTAWLFGRTGNQSFMTKILARAKTAREIQVVQDQKGSPTYAGHLAVAIHTAIKKALVDDGKDVLNSVYHTVNRGSATRYEAAKELLKQANLSHVKITPINSAETNSIVRRPIYSVLDNSRFEKTFGFQFPTWQEAVADYLAGVQFRASYAEKK